MPKNTKWKVLLIVGTVALCIWKVYPPKKTINLGLDLKGGIHLVLQVDLLKYFENRASNIDEPFQKYIEDVQSNLSKTHDNLLPLLSEKANEDNIQLEKYFPDYLADQKYKPNDKIIEAFWDDARQAPDKVVQIITRRIDEFGVAEPLVHTEGLNRVVVQLPGIQDKERAKRLVGRTALMEFKLVSNDNEKLKEAMKGVVSPGYEVLKTSDGAPYLVKRRPELTGAYLQKAIPSQGTYGEPTVSFTLDKKGSKIFALVTEENVGRQLAIVLDEEVLMAPVIKEPITGGSGQISGKFSQSEVQDIANVLNAGALPAPIEIIEDRTVSPTLGKDSVRKGILSGLAVLLIVIIFVAVYYMVNGVIADIALCLNILIIFAGLAWFGATLTLPGIAGIILTIGMAVDANVLINERMREEFKLGKKINAAVAAGYDKAFLTILDSNLTTIFAAVILFIFGTGPIRGFAITLTIGLIASMFTAITVTRTLLDIYVAKTKAVKLNMMQFFKSTKINFIGKKNIAYIISLALIIASIGAAIVKGKNCLGVDFTGGQLVQVQFDKPITVSDIRNSLKEVGLGASFIQGFGAKDYIIRSESGSVDKIEEQLRTKISDNPFMVMRTEEVGPIVGARLARQTVIALLLSFIIMIIYISYRYEFTFAVAGIIALFHDAVITAGLCILTGRQMSLTIVAAILTIIGFSINDTIVIYDRIREDRKLMPKTPFKDIVNLSLNQTLSRTILTSLTTLLVVICLYIFGGDVINDFAFAMLVGVISGSYSTIFVASALLTSWNK